MSEPFWKEEDFDCGFGNLSPRETANLSNRTPKFKALLADYERMRRALDNSYDVIKTWHEFGKLYAEFEGDMKWISESYDQAEALNEAWIKVHGAALNDSEGEKK